MGQVSERIFIYSGIPLAEATLDVLQRPGQNALELLLRKGLELENARTGEQRCDHLEVGVFCRRANQDNGAILHVRQEGVLLCLVEAVDFINQADRAPSVHAHALFRVCHQLPDVLHSRHDRADGDEVGSCPLGDDHCQGSFPRARGSPQDDRGEEPIRLDGPAQHAARPDDLFLTRERFQRSGAHSRSEGCFSFDSLLPLVFKEVHDRPIPFLRAVRCGLTISFGDYPANNLTNRLYAVSLDQSTPSGGEVTRPIRSMPRLS